MDKELKELKMIVCRCCPYGPDTTKACDARYCDIKKVMEENYEIECAKNRNLYAKYISAIRENMDIKIKLNEVDERSKEKEV